MELLCMGVNHRTAPLAVREGLSLTEPALGSLCQRMRQAHSPLREVAVISTCNRFEVYAVGPADGQAYLREVLCALSGPLRPETEQQLLWWYERDAVRHLCAVAAGLDSMVLGEPQILGQVVGAHERALACDSGGLVLDALLRQAIACGKRVRAETAIDEGSASVGHVAVELAMRELPCTQDLRALVIGAGEMAEAVARHLRECGVRRVAIANRSLARAECLAHAVGGTVYGWSGLPEALASADLAICCVGAQETVLDSVAVAEAMTARPARPLVIVDIGVPRNVAPEVVRLPNVRLYDIDALQTVVDRHRADRERAVPEAWVIVESCVDAFVAWYNSLSVVPTICDLHAAAAEVRDAEVTRALQRLGDLSAAERRVVQDLGRRIVAKLLHHPTVRLKHSATTGRGAEYAAMLGDLFGLDAECDVHAME